VREGRQGWEMPYLGGENGGKQSILFPPSGRKIVLSQKNDAFIKNEGWEGISDPE